MHFILEVWRQHLPVRINKCITPVCIMFLCFSFLRHLHLTQSNSPCSVAFCVLFSPAKAVLTNAIICLSLNMNKVCLILFTENVRDNVNPWVLLWHNTWNYPDTYWSIANITTKRKWCIKHGLCKTSIILTPRILFRVHSIAVALLKIGCA